MMKKINLNGAWRMRDTSEECWHEAAVPGTVYTDLLRDGVMEDPFWRDNEMKAFALMVVALIDVIVADFVAVGDDEGACLVNITELVF